MASKLRQLLHTPLGVFLVFLVLYTATWGGHFTSGDGTQKIAWAEAMLLRGTARFEAPIQDRWYSLYGVGHSLLALPSLGLAHALQQLTGLRAKGALYTYLFILNGALLLGLVARYLRPHYPPRAVWTVVGLMGVATWWWPYTKLDFSEPLVLTCLMGGLVWMKEGRVGWGLLVASFAWTVRMDALPLVLALAAWQVASTHSLAQVPRMGVALLPSLAVNAVANAVRFGSWLQSGYEEYSFTNPLLVGLYGILFSAGKSVFLFSPPLVLGFWGWRRFHARPALRYDAWLFAALFAFQTVFYARWWDWSGDDSWGVRFLLPGVMLMIIPAVEALESPLRVAAVGAVGLCVQLLGVLTGPLTYVLLVHQQPLMREALYVGGTHRIDFEDVRFNPRYSQLAGHWVLLQRKLGLGPAPTARMEVERTGTPLADALELPAERIPWDFIWPELYRMATGKRSAPESTPAPPPSATSVL